MEVREERGGGAGDEAEISELGVDGSSVEEEEAKEREEEERDSEELVAVDLFREVRGRSCHMGKNDVFWFFDILFRSFYYWFAFWYN